MVKQYIPLQVVDSKTGEDITRSILLQIIADLEDGNSQTLLTNYMLENIVRMHDDPMAAMLAAYMDQSVKTFMAQQKEFKAQFEHQMQSGQEDAMKDLSDQYMEYWSKFNPYGLPK